MASDVDDPSLNKSPAEELKMVEEQSDEATDDIVGIHEGDDLSKLLPNETMFLAYPELEVIFYKHLIDKRLMNYRTKGKRRTLRKVKAQSPENKQVDKEKGPFILWCRRLWFHGRFSRAVCQGNGLRIDANSVGGRARLLCYHLLDRADYLRIDQARWFT